MKNRCEFARLSNVDEKTIKEFRSMMFDYIAETGEHINRPLKEEFQEQCFNGLIAMQDPADFHLEMCRIDGVPIGFFSGRIVHEDNGEFIKKGCGYIMEFYVRPEYRRQKYGKLMLHRLEELLTGDGADTIYLTAEPITGKPFWEAMGFNNTGEKLPENQFYIYKKFVG